MSERIKPTKDTKLYSVNEVAEFLGVTTRSVYNYLLSGQLKGVKMGKFWKISDRNLSDFIAKGTDKDYFIELRNRSKK